MPAGGSRGEDLRASMLIGYDSACDVAQLPVVGQELDLGGYPGNVPVSGCGCQVVVGGLACIPGLSVVLGRAQADVHILRPTGQANAHLLAPVAFEVFECLVKPSHGGSFAYR